jgi:hypothetical protein
MKARLAPLIVDPVADYWRKADPEFDRLARMLETPIDPNHMPRHPALGPVMVEAARQHAHVYVFDQHSFTAATSIMDTDRRRDFVFQNARAPHARMFMEMTTFGHPRTAIHGIFTEGDREDCLISLCCLFKGKSIDFALPTFQVRTNFADWVGRICPQSLMIRDFTNTQPGNEPRPTDIERKQEAVAGVYMAAMCWMFLSVQGATVMSRTLTRKGKKATRRGFAMSAIDSYNTVRLNLPGRHYERLPKHFVPGPGVRWHQVRGHLRHVTADGERVLRWIAEYERGDDKMRGVLVKETHVTVPK